MRIFNVTGADHFCKKFGATAGPSAIPIGSLLNRICAGWARDQHGTFREGTKQFDELRDCLLRDVERELFMAASQYRRSLDLMIPGSASWAHVTLYYGCFYAASAFLGMFGGWINAPHYLVEVTRAVPGQQELTVRYRPSSIQGMGTHRAFWDQFYGACNSLYSWVPAKYLPAIQPVGSDSSWQIDSRNAVNYDSHNAIQLLKEFEDNFAESTFPNSLPGDLNTQYKITEATVLLAFDYARTFNLDTDALRLLLKANVKRRAHIKRHVFDATIPNLEGKCKKADILL